MLAEGLLIQVKFLHCRHQGIQSLAAMLPVANLGVVASSI